MGWRKKSRGLFKKAKGLAMMDPGTKAVVGALKKQSSSDDEPRAEAAAQLVKKSATRQGGGAQVNFTTEELV